MNAPQNNRSHESCRKRQRLKLDHRSLICCRGGSTDAASPRRSGGSARPGIAVEFDSGRPHASPGRRDVGSMRRSAEGRAAGPSLSISLDASQCLHRPHREYPTPTAAAATATAMRDGTTHDAATDAQLSASNVLAQSLLLLPPLLLARRVLNSLSAAAIDYFRGRHFRTAFTRLERLYLRYYEFPAAARAVCRVAAQSAILASLEWALRWWIWGILGDVGSSLFVGASAADVDVGGNDAMERDWNGCLPCHEVGRGVPWLCGVVWIGAVVGAGHACAMALSKWGGPLRLQSDSSHQPQKPSHVLSWIIHHPIQWIRSLDEWKHFASFKLFNGESSKRKRRRWRVFNPDPLLFPATWMPLRWLQIHAIAVAFATDPTKYNWCNAEDQLLMIRRLMNAYLLQLALGDEWTRVFLGECRVGLGIVAVACYFVALAWMVFTTFTMNAGAAAMLIPSLLAVILSGLMNISIFWNRMGTWEQKRALVAMGWVNSNE